MQEYLTGQCVTAHAGAFAGPMPMREEGLLPKVFLNSARSLGTSAKAMVSRMRAANPLKATAVRDKKGAVEEASDSDFCAEADFREDLRHFLDPSPKGRTADQNN